MRLIELDLFRFIAALGVVLFHYVAWFVIDNPSSSTLLDSIYLIAQYGFLGVPLFFMISGFVILASAFNRNNIEFAAARFARLYPIYWLCVSITALAVWLIGDSASAVELKQYIVNMTMLQSFVKVSNIDGVYWTLAKELQFYFCIFLLISFGVIRRAKIWVSIWFIATITFLLFKQPFFMGWFISPEYSAFFIAGVCSFLMYNKQDTLFFTIIYFLTLPLAAVSTYQTSPGFLANATEFERYVSIGVVVVFYVAFWLLASGKIKFHQQWHGSIISLGALTYPLYLIHNRAGKILLDYLEPFIGPELAVLVSTLLMLVISYLMVIHFEQRVAKPLKIALLKLTNKLSFLTFFSHRNKVKS
ncbi:acyltransferase family protein [Pleionea sediminis]|uniref:acyltransferase family protein n=1 Tax=Pleionea sediminis TaxID=2569479 RepID=UPI001186B335|nr:acyltransferase [Pleionea sediminis]